SVAVLLPVRCAAMIRGEVKARGAKRRMWRSSDLAKGGDAVVEQIKPRAFRRTRRSVTRQARPVRGWHTGPDGASALPKGISCSRTHARRKTHAITVNH